MFHFCLSWFLLDYKEKNVKSMLSFPLNSVRFHYPQNPIFKLEQIQVLKIFGILSDEPHFNSLHFIFPNNVIL